MSAEAIAALRAGKPVVLPTDTVYGLCVSAHDDAAAGRLYELKGRPHSQPVALLAADLEQLFECLPELRGRSGLIASALLPGPYTLVFPNPAHRYRWLTGDRPETIGVRVAEVPAETRAVLAAAGCVGATSANLAGGPDPRRLEEVPEEIRAGAGALVDAGELPGTPSTVIDCTGDEPKVLREGAVPAAEALGRLASAVRSG